MKRTTTVWCRGTGGPAMTPDDRSVRGYHVVIASVDTPSGQRCRGELWWYPHADDGWICATTRWVSTRAAAGRDVKKYLSVPMRKGGQP